MDRLSFEAKGEWRFEGAPGADGTPDTLWAYPAGLEGASLLVLKGEPVPGLTPEKLPEVGATFYPDWEGITASRWTPGSTRTGLRYVVFRSRPGDGFDSARVCFLIDVGGAVQSVSLIAESPGALKKLEALVSPGLMRAKSVKAAQGPPADAGVASAAQSPPARDATRPTDPTANTGALVVANGFSIDYAQPRYLLAEEKWDFSRDPSGKVWLAISNKLTLYGRLPGDCCLQTLKDDGASQDSDFSVFTLANALGEGDWREFASFEGDAAGNFFVGITVGSTSRGGRHTVFAVARQDTGQWEAIAPRGTVLALGDGSNWGSDAVLRPTLSGDAWLFVKQGKGPMRMGYLQRSQEGGWSLSEVPVGEALAALRPDDLAWGSADHQGNYLFFTADGFSRIRRDGSVAHTQLVVPREGGGISRPVVLANGDIWVALSESLDVFQYTTPKDARTETLHSTVTLSGRSGLVRIRLDKRGQPTLRIIEGDAVLDALGKAGMPIHSRVLHMSGLWVDQSTGGLLTYDRQNHVVFSVRPID